MRRHPLMRIAVLLAILALLSGTGAAQEDISISPNGVNKRVKVGDFIDVPSPSPILWRRTSRSPFPLKGRYRKSRR